MQTAQNMRDVLCSLHDFLWAEVSAHEPVLVPSWRRSLAESAMWPKLIVISIVCWFLKFRPFQALQLTTSIAHKSSLWSAGQDVSCSLCVVLFNVPFKNPIHKCPIQSLLSKPANRFEPQSDFPLLTFCYNRSRLYELLPSLADAQQRVDILAVYVARQVHSNWSWNSPSWLEHSLSFDISTIHQSLLQPIQSNVKCHEHLHGLVCEEQYLSVGNIILEFCIAIPVLSQEKQATA